MNSEHIDVKQDSLLDSLVLYTKLFHKPFSKEALMLGLPVSDISAPTQLFSINGSKSLFSRVAARAGLKSTLIQRPISQMLELHLPMIVLLANDNSCILDSFSQDRKQVKIIYCEGEGLEDWVDTADLEKVYLGFSFLLKKEFQYDQQNSRTLQLKQKHWFWSTLNLSRGIYKDVLWASLLVNLFVIATPLFTMNVYDRVIPNNAQETLMVFTIGIVFIYLLDFFLKVTRAYLLEVAAKKSDIIMSSIIFEKVMDLKMEEHPPSVGSFANNLRDFESVRSFFTTATMTAVIDLPFALIFLAIIYYIAGNLVFVPIVTIFLILAYSLFVKKPIKESIELSHEASATKNGLLIETLQNIETIKTMGMSSKMQWKWEEATGEIAKSNLKSRMLSSSLPNITNLLIQLNTVFVIVFGVYMIQEFDLTMGGLIAAVMLTARTVSPMGQAASLISTYSDARSSYETLEAIISKPREREEGQEFLNLDNITGKIEFQNVSFSYPDAGILALDNVSFSIESGEKVAIIGKIGSGKSTITKLLLKLYAPTSGTILIDGIDISQIDPANLRQSISYVPQDIHLFKGTVKDNIISSERAPSDEDVVHVTKISGAYEFVHSHPKGYDMPIGERGAGLSGGQKQSIGVARALLSDSVVMLMDEPTNAMDQSTETNLIVNLQKEIIDKTMILVTHKLNILGLVDRVIVMNNSKVLIDGSKDEVVRKLQGGQ